MGFFDDLANMVLTQPTAGMQLSPDQQRAIALSQLATATDVTGKLIGTYSHYQYGQQAAAADEFQAAQLRQNAGQAQAAAQHDAYEVDKQSQYVASAALAAAAGSGGGASDPTVVNIMARNAGEGAYRKALALYQGDDRARLMNMQADAKEFEGQNIKANSNEVATSQLLAAGTAGIMGMAQTGGLYSRFGRGGPGATTG